MKATSYRMTLSDGHKYDVKANSAGEAIERARRDHRGYTVTECHSGMTEAEAQAFNNAPPQGRRKKLPSNLRALPGVIVHDVPPHRPYSASDTFDDDSEPVRIAPERGSPALAHS